MPKWTVDKTKKLLTYNLSHPQGKGKVVQISSELFSWYCEAKGVKVDPGLQANGMAMELFRAQNLCETIIGNFTKEKETVEL